MQVVTTRLDDKDLKELSEIENAEKADRAIVIRKLLARGTMAWRLESAVKKLRDREISIRKAAELARLPYSEMLDIMERENIDSGYTLKDLYGDFGKLKK
ncbi:MAG: UPF0175 family protein [Candidatus Diapherotrites archaeon]|uniref:UPF0175 family protein n=1 Tax=Candidatus Iainarchaeum sp. TaxID=3101447 RepID=A0A8T3YKX2_9ARCH|nr:UPF0175 family protein [Candidatus Diapherotrites archaeon]